MRKLWNITRLSVIILGAVVFIYCIPLVWLFPWTLHMLEKEGKIQDADLIVILEGTLYKRIDYGITLAEAGYAKTIFFPAPYYDENIEHLDNMRAETKESITWEIGNGASSTFEEAIQTKKFLQGRNIDSLLLVTSPYHSYRAWWLFQKILPDTDIVSAPVPYDKPWLEDGEIDKTHRHYRYAWKERLKFVYSYLAYGWRVF